MTSAFPEQILGPATREVCDSCGVAALVILAKGDLKRTLCGHHGNKVIRLILAENLGWEIISDSRGWRPEGALAAPLSKEGSGTVPGAEAGGTHLPDGAVDSNGEDDPGDFDQGEAGVRG